MFFFFKFIKIIFWIIINTKIYIFFFYTFSNNFFFSLETNLNFNYINFLILKKNNAVPNKISNLEKLSTNFNFLEKINQTKYFFNTLYSNQRTKLNFLINLNNNVLYYNKISLKFIDLKKKFFKTLLENRFFSNYLLNFKKNKFKNYFKNYKIFLFFFKKNNFNFYSHNFLNLLLFSKFFFNFSDLNWFLSKNFIYLNRKKINELKIILFKINKNDLIELNFFKTYFIYLQKKLQFLKYNRILVFNNNKNFSSFYLTKVVNRLNNYSYSHYSTFLNIEVDFKTLSIIYLYSNNKNNFINKFFKDIFVNNYILDYYKWKKLT